MLPIMGKNPLSSMGFYPFVDDCPLKYRGGMEKTFRQALNDHLDRTDTKISEIADATGIKRDAIYAVKRGTTLNMNVVDAIRIAAYFGETVEQFMGLAPDDIDQSLQRQISALSAEERRILSASIAALTASRHPSPPASDPGAAPDARAVPSTKNPSNPKLPPPKKSGHHEEQ